MPWINGLWGWAQNLGAPPAALPPFVPAPTPMEPAAIKQEQFADHHEAVSEHTLRQKVLFNRICANGELSAEDEAFLTKHSDVVFVDPLLKKP